MPKLNFNVTAQVLEGPKVSVGAQNWDVEAYDRIDSKIAAPVAPATTADTTVQVAPGMTANAVTLLVVYADSYSPPLTYKAKPAATAATLDKPLVLWGANAVKLLEPQLESITFTNSGAAENTVHILVARDATP